MKVVGQLILVEGTKHNNITELEDAVEEGTSAYMRKFPKAGDLVVYMSDKTKTRWNVNGEVGGVEAFQDDDVPAGYIWVIDVRDQGSFSPKKIN